MSTKYTVTYGTVTSLRTRFTFHVTGTNSDVLNDAHNTGCRTKAQAVVAAIRLAKEKRGEVTKTVVSRIYPPLFKDGDDN